MSLLALVLRIALRGTAIAVFSFTMGCDHAPFAIDAPDLPERTIVIVAAGQSNAANHGKPRSRGGRGTFAFGNGHFFHCDDPLPGATGTGGSVWPRLARKLLDTRCADAVVTCSVAQGSTTVEQWLPNSTNFNRLISTCEALAQYRLSPTMVVWHQGESDAENSTLGTRYQTELSDLIESFRSHGYHCPWIVCLATRQGKQTSSQDIREAQRAIVNQLPNVYLGPDTDSYDVSLRSDGTHFNNDGFDRFARELMSIIEPRFCKQSGE